MVAAPVIPPAPIHFTDEALHRRLLAEKINTILAGGMNAHGQTVTLAASATSTTLHNPQIGGYSFIDLMPTTASAATAKGSVYFTALGDGVATIHHASNAAVDQTFLLLVLS